MQRTARLIARRRARGKPVRPAGGARSPVLPPLLFFTDPVRTPDPETVAVRLPRGSAVVYRPFGASDAEARAHRLRALTRARGVMLLIGQDVGLARRIGADGVHLPERLAHRAGPLRRAQPGWIVTTAAHSLAAARRGGAHAVVISAAFPSRSASAGAPLGPIKLAALVRAAGRPAYALGGINMKTARRLLDGGLVGIAAVEGLSA